MRHSLKALRYSGVLHNDPYARNILCPSIHQQGSGPPGIVVIDFAHSELWLQDEDGTPPAFDNELACPHFLPLLEEMGFSHELLRQHWEPLEEIEF